VITGIAGVLSDKASSPVLTQDTKELDISFPLCWWPTGHEFYNSVSIILLLTSSAEPQVPQLGAGHMEPLVVDMSLNQSRHNTINTRELFLSLLHLQLHRAENTRVPVQFLLPAVKWGKPLP